MITNVNYNLSDACRKILENMPFIEFKDGEVSKEKITMVRENGSVIHFVGSVVKLDGNLWRTTMNTFKRLAAAISLSTTFFAHNVQAAPSDAVCVALGKWGGAVVELKQLGMSEQEQMKRNIPSVKSKVARDTMVRVIRYVYVDDGKYVDAKYIYLKCKVGDFD